MTRALVLLLVLAGCTAAPPEFPACPDPVPVPAGVPKHPTRAQTDALEIRVELWAEALRQRGDACADAVDARDEWIGRMQK